MEPENIDLNGFVISHSTDSQCAASLFQAAHGEGSVDPGDIELSRMVQFGEGGGWAHFAFFIGKRIVCCCAHSVPLTDAILEDARGFRIRMLMLFAERHPEKMEWPMEVEQFGAPMSKELMDQGIALIRGQSEDDDMLGRLKDMNSVYTYTGTEELTEDELDSIPGEKVRVIAVERVRSRPEPLELEVLNGAPVDAAVEDLLLDAAGQPDGPGYLRPHAQVPVGYRMCQIPGVAVVRGALVDPEMGAVLEPGLDYQAPLPQVGVDGQAVVELVLGCGGMLPELLEPHL